MGNYLEVTHCPRCGRAHNKIEVQPLNRAGTFHMYGSCPETGQPILIMSGQSVTIQDVLRLGPCLPRSVAESCAVTEVEDDEDPASYVFFVHRLPKGERSIDLAKLLSGGGIATLGWRPSQIGWSSRTTADGYTAYEQYLGLRIRTANRVYAFTRVFYDKIHSHEAEELYHASRERGDPLYWNHDLPPDWVSGFISALVHADFDEQVDLQYRKQVDAERGFLDYNPQQGPEHTNDPEEED